MTLMINKLNPIKIPLMLNYRYSKLLKVLMVAASTLLMAESCTIKRICCRNYIFFSRPRKENKYMIKDEMAIPPFSYIAYSNKYRRFLEVRLINDTTVPLMILGLRDNYNFCILNSGFYKNDSCLNCNREVQKKNYFLQPHKYVKIRFNNFDMDTFNSENNWSVKVQYNELGKLSKRYTLCVYSKNRYDFCYYKYVLLRRQKNLPPFLVRQCKHRFPDE